MIPFSAEVYFAVLAAYNAAVWPAHLLWLGLGGLAVAAAWRHGRGLNLVPGLVLAAAWAWTAIAYFYLQFAQIDFWSYGVAALFGVQAVLLAGVGTASGFDRSAPRWVPVAFAVVGLAAYPLLGFVLRGNAAEAGWFGTSPAPTVLVTLALVAGLRGRARFYLLALPAAWCVWQSVFAYRLMIVEDFLLAPAMIAAVAVCLRSRRVEVE